MFFKSIYLREKERQLELHFIILKEGKRKANTLKSVFRCHIGITVNGRRQSGTAEANFASHPLIHSLLGSAQAQNVDKKKAEPKTSHFSCLNQDIVAGSQE